MIDRHLQLESCGSLLKYARRLPLMVTLLVAWLPLSAAIAQDFDLIATEPQELQVRVLDEDGAPIEDATLTPLFVVYEQSPRVRWRFNSCRASIITNEEGAATLDLFSRANRPQEPIAEVEIGVKHDSFINKQQCVQFDDDEATIVLQRGVQIAASAIDPVTNRPIQENLYAMTNGNALRKWELKSNGTLVSPALSKEKTGFRLVQIIDGKATRFSKLLEIAQGEESRQRFEDVEMVDAVTVTGRLGAEVPRPVKFGIVMASVSQIGDFIASGSSWCWKSFSKVNADGTFTIEGIPADCDLQVHCTCKGWGNKPLSEDDIRFVFPKATNNPARALPMVSRIGDQNTAITVPMQPLGSVTIRVTDENDQPVKRAKIYCGVFKTVFYSESNASFNAMQSSANDLVRLRRQKRETSIESMRGAGSYLSPVLRGLGLKCDRLTDATGSLVIDDVPPSQVFASATSPAADRARVQMGGATVKSNENLDIKLKLILPDLENGGEDD